MKYRLGDICLITKGETGIMKAIPGPYTMVTLGDTNKTHNEYQFDANAVIIPLVSSTGHGHASMRQVKYQEGKFALGNILCAVIPNDENFVLAKYLQIYLHLYRNELLVSQMKGMANVSLPMNRIADVQVEIPDIEKQRKIVEIEKKVTQNSVKLHHLFSEQKGLASQLKQTILQNAIQGKLTAEWRKEHPAEEPASELLKRIKLEKQQMIASGKLKKEKPLEPIKPEEIPFEIPESWTWGRLGEITYPVGNKENQIQSNQIQKEGAFPAVSQGQDLIDGYSDCAEKVITDLPLIMFGDHTRNVKYIDFAFIISADGTKFFKPIEVPPKYLYYLISYTANALRNKGYARHFSLLKESYLPIPPMTEQYEIVDILESFYEKVESLIGQISESERTSEELLKAIVGEVMG